MTTTLDQAREVLTDPSTFDFPGHVGRGSDLSASTADTRSGHYVFPPVSPEAVARGMAVFASELERALDRADSTFDAMQVLRDPVARATCAAAMPGSDADDRDLVAGLVLAWIDALGPVIAAARPPRRWSRLRRRELHARVALEETLDGLDSVTESPQVLATLLAAGIQVPIAAGSWLLVWLAAHPEHDTSPEHTVWEALRLTPPTWITGRVTTKDVRLGAEDIPSGSLVMVSPLLLGRLPELVPGADLDRARFDPSRWDSGEVRPGAWLPFGAGPHACPGRTLGLAMLRHLATWASDVRLTLPEVVHVDQSRGIFPSPALVTAPAEVRRP